MTAIVDTVPAVPLSRRWASVIRIHMANPWPTLVTPWLITVAIFGLNYAIWHIVLMAAGDGRVDPGAFQSNGGITWIFVYMVVVAVQSMNQTFRFAMGFSFTRRDYYLGTAAYFAALSAFYALGITLLAGVEHLTNGWGVDGAFFAAAFTKDLPLIQVAYVYFVVLLFLFFLGTAAATVYVRWATNGMFIFFGSLAIVLVGASWIVTRSDGWETVGTFFTDHGLATIVSWSLPLTALAALAGYSFLRRATPRA